MTEAELLRENIDGYRDSERRLGLCARCPETGGACATDVSVVPVGEMPMWKDRRLTSVPCPRFGEYRVRRRLENSGVPAYYWDSTIQKYSGASDPAALQQIAEFGNLRARSARPWLVVTGPPRSGKTRLAVCVLRKIIRQSPRTLLWYSDVTAIRNVMRQRYDDKNSAPDPFENAREATVLVVDNVDPSKHKSEPWVHDRIEALLRERWLDGAATLVLTHEPITALAEAYPTITDFSETNSCQLS